MIESTEDLLNEYPHMGDIMDFSDEENEEKFFKSISGKNRRSRIDDLTVFSDFHDSISSDRIDREIENLLREAPAVKQEEFSNFIDLGQDKTEYIIRETHKLINSIPKGVFSSTQGENYQKLLTSSINKLVNQLEGVKLENKKLQNKQSEVVLHSKEQVVKLKEQVAQFERENRQLKLQLKASQNEVNAKNEASDKEKSLLRNKLIKYKQLYDNKVKEENLKVETKSRATSKSDKEVGLRELVLKLIRENETEKAENLKRDSEELKQKEVDFGQERENIQHEKEDKTGTLEKDIEGNTAEHDGQFDGSQLALEVATLIKHAVETKKRKVKFMESNDNELKVDPKIGEAQKRPESARDIILKCVIEYPSETGREKCKQCNTEEVLPKEGPDSSSGDTVNLMGEYKWTI